MRGVSLAAILIASLLASCRTGRPTGTRVAPLVATSADDALQQLRARRATFGGMKSLMRIRATTQEKTQSFRAQLIVHDARTMDLIAYTPVGTTAMTMHVDGDHVKVRNHIENTEWEGGASELPAPFKFLASSTTPVDIALLVLGYPPPDAAVEATAAGLSSATVGDATFVFTPPAFPAKSVVVTLGTDRVEIEHIEVVSE